MPFVKRSIEPVNVRRGALKSSQNVSLGEEHEVIVNKSYTQILLQISQLANYANEIFKDLSQECQGVIARSHRLKSKVWEVEQKTRQLNVLETPLPESSLEEVGLSVRSEEPRQPEQEVSLFTAVSRPNSVQKLYSQAKVTPRAVYAALGPSGWKSAKNFCLTPVLKEPGETTYKLVKRQRSAYKIEYERNERLKPPRPRARSAAPRPRSCAGLLDYTQQAGKSVLPTPEENVLRSAKSQPSILVPIDTSATAFERFAQSRASLRNIQSCRQSYADRASSLSRLDPRRQTISGTTNSPSRCECEEALALSTEKLLETSIHESRKQSKRKDPDLYIEDNAELYNTESRSQSKEKKVSVIKKLVRRSKSLPRNIGRAKSRETLIPPDFYDINPQHSLIVSEPGAYLNENNEKIYTNFYGAPNTELPSPQPLEKVRKSKSEHQIADRVRSKSSSLLEDAKLRVGKSRPRSVSAERSHSVHTADDRKYSSLSRTLTGFFGKGKKQKPLPPSTATAAAQSRDSLNTVFTSSSDGPEAMRRQGKRLSVHTTTSTHNILRKRHSKATTSSSGRWSGSERFSMDSDGLFSSTSQQRLSRLSADRDSALGADITDSRLEEMRSPVTMDETNSLYSVDQDGFFTTMHTDIHLAQDNQSLDDSPDLEEEFAKLSLLGSSTNTSTHTLNDSAKTPTSNHNGSSLGSFPDSEQTEEISQRVQLKVEAGRTINRYSLVMKLSEDEDDDEAFAEQTPTRRSVSKDSQSHLTRSQTYESELDLVLEDLSDAETGTIHSDVESIVSVKLPGTAPVTSTPVESADTESYSSKHDLTVKSPTVMTSGDQVAPHDQLLRYKLLNGSTKYQKITPTSAAVQSAASQSTVGQSIQTEGEESRSYKSLPRNIKHHVTSGGHLNGLLSTLDNMGSWPRKLSKINAGLSKESQPKDSELSEPVAQTSTVSSQSKRRSISPGKLKLNTSSTNQKTEKIHSLIEEARRMSSTDITVKRPLSRPLSQPESTFNSITSTPGTHPQADTVSPYASCSVLTTPPKSQVENFIRQPSYKLACSHQETPRGYLPRSFSEEPKSMRRNFSYRLANSSVTSSTNDTVPEDKVLDTYTEGPGFVRAPSYKMAQTASFDRKLRAPSYRRAVETLHSEFDSGLGSGDMTSSGSLMTSSSDSAHSDHSIGRPTQLKTSTEGVYSPPDGPPVVLHHAVIKECMKGVYENEEVHLPRKLTVPSKPELVSISMNSESHHYSVPRVPAQPTSFHPTYANIEYGGKSKQAHKKYLQPSKSAPAPPTESKDTTRSISAGVAMTPPTRSSNRKQRPMSSYMPNGNEESENIVPDSRLMLPKYNQSSVFFPSMEMLKREEMAVKSVLGKIKRSTRPLSYVQTDI